MKANKPYVVTHVKIENWDECGESFRVVFARSKEQAAAAYGVTMARLGYHLSTIFGMDEANPGDPYVYPVKVSTAFLRHLLGDDYYEVVLEPEPVVLTGDKSMLWGEPIMEVFMKGEKA